MHDPLKVLEAFGTQGELKTSRHCLLSPVYYVESDNGNTTSCGTRPVGAEDAFFHKQNTSMIWKFRHTRMDDHSETFHLTSM